MSEEWWEWASQLTLSQDCGGFISEWKLWVSKNPIPSGIEIIKKKRNGSTSWSQFSRICDWAVLAWFLQVYSEFLKQILEYCKLVMQKRRWLWCWFIQRSIFGTLRSFLLFWCEFLTDILRSTPHLLFTPFQWKGTGEFINTKFWCRVCSVLHSQKVKIILQMGLSY